MKHCMRQNSLQGELSFSKVSALEAQTVLNISVIVNMQLHAVSPLSKYLVQMYNLLVVR